MKMTPELEKAYKNMAPGLITAEGFLGTDTRNLADILAEDAQLFKKCNLDPVLLAARMRYFLEAGQRGLGEPVSVDSKWIVSTDEARGKLPCPWQDGVRRKINVTIERKDDGSKCTYTDLSIHLLEAHGFLEGRGSAFRLDLELIKHILYM